MDVLDIERADGTRWKVSLRRSRGDGHHLVTAEDVTREFGVLRLVEAAGIPAPRPVLLDAGGDYFGVPALVLSYLPGRPLLATRNIGAWTQGLATAALTVHAVTPDKFDLSGLEVRLRDGLRDRISGWRVAAKTDRLAAEIHAALETKLDNIVFSEPALVHSDYWWGNTVWYRGRLTGVVDWSSAKAGDPRTDVAQCRIDLVLGHGVEVADGFRDDYERLAGKALPDLWYFDLYRGFDALLEYKEWLEGYYDLGLHHLKPADVEARLRAFLRRALDKGRR